MLRVAACLLAAFALAPGAASAVTLPEKAKESGCVSRPKQVEGTMFKCETGSGASSYFNVPDGAAGGQPGIEAPLRRPNGNGNGAPAAAPAPTRSDPSTPGFPRVDAETQKGRDDMRRRVLSDELSAEEKLLTDARSAYADGAPAPLPEERTSADKYRERIGRLRQAVVVHERNIEALKRELGNLR